MAVYSVGTPIVSAQVKFVKDGTVTIKQIAKGDTLTDIVLDNYPEDITLDKATVVGFTLKSYTMPRGANRVYDGIPTYMPDTKGDHRYGVIEETAEISQVLVELPVPKDSTATEGAKRFLNLATIKSFSGGTDVEASSEEDETGSKEPTTPTPETPEESTDQLRL